MKPYQQLKMSVVLTTDQLVEYFSQLTSFPWNELTNVLFPSSEQ